MSFIIDDNGQLRVGPPADDPIRQAHARLAADLHWQLESSLQASECHSILIERLTKRVELLEQLLTGTQGSA